MNINERRADAAPCADSAEIASAAKKRSERTPERTSGMSPASVSSAGSTTSPITMPRVHSHYRAIWVSDVHLGTAGCKAEYLLDFLRFNESWNLYLVGDIIDGWQLRKHWYWKQSHNDVVQKVLRKARKGTQVTYITGNHDEVLRQFAGLAFGDIRIVNEAVHHTLDNRRFLVTHGDFFDGIIEHARWLAYLGDTLYTLILRVNDGFNRIRHRMGLSYWSVSQYLKHKVKNAVSFISEFESVLVREAKRRGFDGVVCGHIHKAEIREIDGILYCNDGDWVESLCALVETHEGELKLVHWPYRASDQSSEDDDDNEHGLPIDTGQFRKPRQPAHQNVQEPVPADMQAISQAMSPAERAGAQRVDSLARRLGGLAFGREVPHKTGARHA